jgi:hypothetical protein
MNRPFPPTLRKGLPATGYNPRVGRAGKPTFAGRPQQEDIAPIYLYLSLIPIFILVGVGLAGLGLTRLRKRNEERKLKVLKEYGWSWKEEEVKQSQDEPMDSGLRNRKRGAVVTTSKTPSEKPLIVGFWHPYWYVVLLCFSSALTIDYHSNAGGGGERVLWTAIAWVQATHPNGRVLSVVYTGDYPEASKEEILHKVKVCPFLIIQLRPLTLLSKGTIRYHPRTLFDSLRIAKIAACHLGLVLAQIHPSRTKCRKRLACAAGYGVR